LKVINTNRKFSSGFVKVNGKEIYVDLLTQEGLKELFELMGGIIYKLSNIILPVYNCSDDARQEVCLIMIEGIVYYNKKCNASMSTFLYKYTYNKVIDIVRKNNKIKNYKYEELTYSSNVEDKIDIMKCVNMCDKNWKNAIYKVFIMGENIKKVSEEMNMTPWGFSRSLYKKFRRL